MATLGELLAEKAKRQESAKSALQEQEDFGDVLIGEFTPEQEQAGREFISETVSNIPSSTFNMGSNIFQAITSPIDTSKAVGNLALGTIQLAIPGEQNEEQFANAFGTFIIDRYGSQEKFANSLKKDPVGVVADFAGFVTGIGGILSVGGKLSGVQKVNTIANALKKAGRGIDPVGIAGKTVGRIAQARKPINSLIKTALRFGDVVEGKSRRLEKIDALADAFLKTKLKLNRESINIIQKQRTAINKQIQNIIDEGVEKGVVKDVQPIINKMDDLIVESLEKGLEQTSINQMIRLKNFFSEIRGETMNPAQLQKLKKGLNEVFKPNLNENFGAIKDAIRNIQRKGAREFLLESFPELDILNQNDATLNLFDKAIRKRLEFIEQQPIVSSKGLAAGAAGGAAAGFETIQAAEAVKFGIGASLFSKLVDNPNVQITIARALNKARLALAKSGKLPIVTQPAFQAGRLQDLTQPQPQGIQSTLGDR